MLGPKMQGTVESLTIPSQAIENKCQLYHEQDWSRNKEHRQRIRRGKKGPESHTKEPEYSSILPDSIATHYLVSEK